MAESAVVRAEITPLRFRLNPPLRTWRQTVAVREAFVLRLFDRDGVSGAGEAAPAYWLGGETAADARGALKEIAAWMAARPRTLAETRRWAGIGGASATALHPLASPTPPSGGSELTTAPPLHDDHAAATCSSAIRARSELKSAPCSSAARALPSAPHAARSPSTLSALDCALLELDAKHAGVSVAAILARRAGAAESARAVRVSTLLNAESPAALAAQARDGARAGFRTFKLKVGAATLAKDIARARAVAEAAGAGCKLRLDANRAFDFEQAQRLLSALAGAVALEFVEEPLRDGAPETLKRLRELTGVPIALDESFAGRASLTPYLGAGAIDVIVLKAARLGGLTRCAELAALAARAGIAPCVTDSLEGALGMAAAVHLAAAMPSPALAVGLGAPRFISARALEPFPVLSPALNAAGAGFVVRACPS